MAYRHSCVSHPNQLILFVRIISMLPFSHSLIMRLNSGLYKSVFCRSNINKNIRYEPCSMYRCKSCQYWCLYCQVIHLFFMICTYSDVDSNDIIFYYSTRLYYCYIFRNPIYLIHTRISFMINFSIIIYRFYYNDY